MAVSYSVYGATGIATVTTPISFKIYGVAGVASGDPALAITLGPDITGIEPFTTTTLTATVSSGLAVLTITQTLGPAVVLISGTGPVWTYKAPAELDLDGSHVQFRVTATAGSSIASAEVDHWIYPATLGFYNNLVQLRAAEALRA